MRVDPGRGPVPQVEVLSGVAAIAWGLYVWMVNAPIGDLPAYDVLFKSIPDDAWGVVAVVLGAAQTAAALARVRLARWCMAWPMLVLWKVLAVGLINSGETVPAAGVYCAIALANIPVIVALRPRPRLRLPGA